MPALSIASRTVSSCGWTYRFVMYMMVRKWLHRHPRFHIHFTPTGSSWLDLVERFFADLTQDRVRDRSFTSLRQPITATEEYPAARNEEPRRYVRKARGEEILAKIQRAREALAAAVT